MKWDFKLCDPIVSFTVSFEMDVCPFKNGYKSRYFDDGSMINE
jgi:hypothetical protein